MKTSFSMAPPPGHYGRIALRPDLALKQSTDVRVGDVDAD